MKRPIFETARFFFISFEFLIVLIGLVIYFLGGSCVQNLTQRLIMSSEKMHYLVLLPPTLFAWILIYGKKILFPDKDDKKILCDWPNYWRLEIGFRVSLFYGLLFSITSFCTWGMDWKSSETIPIIVLFVSIVGSGVNAYSIYEAILQIDKILTKRDYAK